LDGKVDRRDRNHDFAGNQIRPTSLLIALSLPAALHFDVSSTKPLHLDAHAWLAEIVWDVRASPCFCGYGYG
ncbi:MAG TPA: hypothetical protein VIF60_07995, partial [Burkholderiaceae bacterium]